MLDLIAVTAFGLESVVVRELADLGYEAKPISTGRVLFQGDELAIARANLFLRTADRVLVRLGSFRALDFGELFDLTMLLEWERWIGPREAFPVNGRSVKSRLSSVPACQRIVKKAIVDRLKKAHRVEALPESAQTAPVVIEVSMLEDVATLTIDTSGDGLHKRGYRPTVGDAALKETLAAGLVLLSNWEPRRPLIDPFCGTGTIAIEAAMIAMDLAPGSLRTFAASEWSSFPGEPWDKAEEEARERAEAAAATHGIAGGLKFTIHASDIDDRALTLARKHAKAAGVERYVHFTRRDFADLSSKAEYGCIITNPPYGIRLGEQEQVEELYLSMPSVFRRLPTWSFHILSARLDLERLLGQPASRRRKLFNSQIECGYFTFLGPKPPWLEKEREHTPPQATTTPNATDPEPDLSISSAGEQTAEPNPAPEAPSPESPSAETLSADTARLSPDAQPPEIPGFSEQGDSARVTDPSTAASDTTNISDRGEQNSIATGYDPAEPEFDTRASSDLPDGDFADDAGDAPDDPAADTEAEAPAPPESLPLAEALPPPEAPPPAAAPDGPAAKPRPLPAFGGLRDRDLKEAAEFAACLANNARHLRRWPSRLGITCYRVYDRDAPDVPLIIDRYEDRVHVTEYERGHSRTYSQQLEWYDVMQRAIADVLELPADNVVMKCKPRQRGLSQHERQAESAEFFEAREGGLKFLVNVRDYIDTGLFLDHRQTRAMIRDQAAGRRFLNLFCYTGSFTAYAAAGGAATTTSVDLSNTYLDWAQRNLALNAPAFSPGRTPSQDLFLRSDVLDFLESHRPGHHYDLAVVDPPTFSNSKSTSQDWEVQRGHARLIAGVARLMPPGGVIYFSTNFRRFKLDEEAMLEAGLQWREISRRTVPPDFRNKRIHRCWRLIAGG